MEKIAKEKRQITGQTPWPQPSPPHTRTHPPVPLPDRSSHRHGDPALNVESGCAAYSNGFYYYLLMRNGFIPLEEIVSELTHYL